MKITPPLAAALLLCAVFAAAHAEQVYELPAGTTTLILIPWPHDQKREEQAARALAERREKMITECEQNHGSRTDCERETDTELRAEELLSGRRVVRPAR